LYLLKTLRGQGLSRGHINTVFQSLIISRLAYAIPACGGFLLQHQINKIDSFLLEHSNLVILWSRQLCPIFFVKLMRYCIIVCIILSICIHGLLLPKKKLQTVLRKSHCFELPNCHYKVFKDSFINRVVFKDAY